MAVFIYPQQQVTIPGVATEATLLLVEQNTADTVTELQTANTTLASIDSTTIASNTELTTANGTLTSISGSTGDTVTELQTANATLNNLATEATLSTVVTNTGNTVSELQLANISLLNTETAVSELNARTAGSLTPVEFDEQVITYVLAGNGIGEISTVEYKLATVTVALLTMSYDANDRLSGVVRS